MGELFFTYYETSPNMKFYLCRYCFTHIALQDDAVGFSIVQDPPALYCVFRKGVNLEIERTENHTIKDNFVLGHVLCIGCRRSLGWKHVRVLPSPIPQPVSIQEGRVSIDLQVKDGVLGRIPDAQCGLVVTNLKIS